MESALITVSNDILMAIDNRKILLLTLLDLFATFDAVTHNILLERSRSKLVPFLHSCPHAAYKKVEVLLNSNAVCIGLPQGSGSGAGLYSKYNRDLGDLIRVLS